MTPILTVAHLTLSEARRKRIVTAAALCAAAFLAVYGTAAYFAHRELIQPERGAGFVERQAMLMALVLVGLYAANFLSVLFAVLLPIDTLSGEIDSGVIQTLASKPISRADILLGKWLGHAALVTAYLVALAGGVVLTVWLISGLTPANLERALPLMLLEDLLLMTVSIAGGTRLSTVTNGVMALGFYGIAFVGGWMEFVGTTGGIDSVRTVGVVASLVSPADAMWRLASYYLQPAAVRALLARAPFSTASVPTPLMVWWAVGVMLIVLAWALRSLNRRAL
jgi:ABC-type transport system involved in multi-copper enzyme maturation permease subunit